MFAKAGLTCSIQDFKAPTDELDFILPLRLLLKISKDPGLKEKLSKVDVKVDDSKQRNSRVYGANSDTKIIDTITKKLKVTTSSAEVERAIALVEKFSMVLDGSRGVVAVYLELAQLTHSCRLAGKYYVTMHHLNHYTTVALNCCNIINATT